MADILNLVETEQDDATLRQWHDFENRRTVRLWSDPQTFEEFKRYKQNIPRLLHEAYKDIPGLTMSLDPQAPSEQQSKD